MIGLFISVIVTLSLIAGAAAANYYMLASTQAMLAVQQTQVRMQAISDAMRMRFSVVEGKVAFSLDGVPSDGPGLYQGLLPNDLVFTKTSSGGNILFCPAISMEGLDVTASVVDGDENFDIATRSNYLVGGKANYRGINQTDPSGATEINDETVAALNKNGVYGFLVADNPNVSEEKRPNCSEIIRVKAGNLDTFLVRGGTVTPVFANTSKAVSNEYLVSGIPNSSNSNEVVTIMDALRLVSMNEQSSATIRVSAFHDGNTDDADDNAKIFSLSDASFLDKVGRGRAISIIFENVGPLKSEEANAVFAAEGNWSFTGVDMSDFRISAGPDSTFSFNDSIVGSLEANGGEIFVRGASQVVDNSSATSDAVITSVSGLVAMSANIPGEPAIISSVGGRAAFDVKGGAINIETATTLSDGLLVYRKAPAVNPEGFIPSRAVTIVGSSQLLRSGQVLSPYDDLAVNITQAGPADCGTVGCEVQAYCPSGLTVISADCSADEGGHALSKFGPITNPGDGSHGYSCGWQGALLAPGEPATTVSAKAPSVSIDCGR